MTVKITTIMLLQYGNQNKSEDEDKETPPTFEFSSKLDAAGQPVPFWANAFPLTGLPSIPDQPKK